MLDLDAENKSRGSLGHSFPTARKVNIHTSEGLDTFVDVLDEGSPLVIADMGASAGAGAHRWFDSMFNSVRNIGIVFTAIGIVTPDPASVESVLSWANALQRRVHYLIVINTITDPADLTYWEQSSQAAESRRAFQPKIIEIVYRVPKGKIRPASTA